MVKRANTIHYDILAGIGKVATTMGEVEALLEELLGFYLGDRDAIRAMCRYKNAGSMLQMLEDQVKTSHRLKPFRKRMIGYLKRVKKLNRERNALIHATVIISKGKALSVSFGKDPTLISLTRVKRLATKLDNA